MKKLLLASNGDAVIKWGEEVFEKPLSKMKMVYITTAMKAVEDIDYVLARRKYFQKNNYHFREIDITGKTSAEIEKIFTGQEAVYVEGGNTFYLLKQMKESGFDKIIGKLVDEGLIYIGSSAGSYVACPTIESAEWKRKGTVDRFGLKNLSALNLVPFLLVAHYAPKWQKIIQKSIQESTYPVRILRDGQALLVEGEGVVFLGEDEVKISYHSISS
jgi:dipeptidase E